MRPSLYYLIIPVLGLCACSAHNMSPEDKAYAATADSTSFSGDISKINSSSRKRVKSADARCRVPSVFEATSKLERLVTGLGGVVVESSLQNESVQHYDLPYSADSIKSIQLYTPTANLTLKVPVGSLDSVDQSLTAIASFIEHRVIKDQDMTLKYLANAMRNEQHEVKADKEELATVRREQAAERRDKAAAKHAPSTSVNVHTATEPESNDKQLNAVAYKDQKDDAVIDRRINNLAILDDVAYSTLTIQLYQPQVTDVQIVLNPAQVSRAGFGTELLTAVKSGAEILRNILLFFVQIWPFLIAFVLGWIGYRKFILRRS